MLNVGNLGHYVIICFILYAEISKYEYKCLLIRGRPVHEGVCVVGVVAEGGGGGGGGEGAWGVEGVGFASPTSKSCIFFFPNSLYTPKFGPQIGIFLAFAHPLFRIAKISHPHFKSLRTGLCGICYMLL